jgi:hypothetical protein
MLDAYWMAARLSEERVSPLLPYSEDATRYVPSLDKLIDRMSEARSLVPKHPMPIEPPAMHPRVAAQEGRFIIFGHTRDLLDEKIIRTGGKSSAEEVRLRQIRFKVADVNAVLQELVRLSGGCSPMRAMTDFSTWQEVHNKFSEGAAEYPDFSAN